MPDIDGRRTRCTGRVALAATGAALAVLWSVAASGPSAAEPSLGPRRGWRGALPPYSLGLHLSSAWVTILTDGAYVLGAVGVGLGLLAMHRGYRLPVRRAVLVGSLVAVAAVAVPPMGSADHLSYAAYGRIAAQGGDPYTQPPIDFRGGHDPITSAVEPPWTRTPSVYGPVATGAQALTSLVGGTDLRLTVWAWQLLCLVAWLVIGGLAVRAASDGARAGRAVWLWLLNPVLYGVVLLGAHVDVLATALGLVALVLVTRAPFLAGVALGAAVGTKLTLVLAVPALAYGLWTLGRSAAIRRMLLLVLGAAVVLLPAQLWAGPHVFDQLRQARRFVSLATPWRPIVVHLTRAVHDASSVRDWVVWLSPIAVLIVAVLLWMATRSMGPNGGAGPADRDGGRAVRERAARLLMVLALAYSLAAPYSLPWYDALVWAPLALLPAGPVDVVALVRLAAYAVAYVPGRVMGMSPHVQDVTLDIRREVTPDLGWALLAGVVVLAIRGARDPGPRPDQVRPPTR